MPRETRPALAAPAAARVSLAAATGGGERRLAFRPRPAQQGQPETARPARSTTPATTAPTAASGPTRWARSATSTSTCRPATTRRSRYPLVLWLHGFAQDEQSFLRRHRRAARRRHRPRQAAAADRRRARRQPQRPRLPQDRRQLLRQHATPAGFEDFVMGDVWNFLHEQLPHPPRARGPRPGRRVDGRRGGLQPRPSSTATASRSSSASSRRSTRAGSTATAATAATSTRAAGAGSTDFRRHEVVGRFYGVVTVRREGHRRPALRQGRRRAGPRQRREPGRDDRRPTT